VYSPTQLQVQGPEPETKEAIPAEQRFSVGAEVKLAPSLEPQTPLTGRSPVEQETVAPPLNPSQFQDQGPEPKTAEAVPIEQRFVVGADVTLAPSLEPQTPSKDLSAVQLALVPELIPLQVQETELPAAGKEGIELILPVAQNVSSPPKLVSSLSYVFAAVPQVPLTIVAKAINSLSN